MPSIKRAVIKWAQKRNDAGKCKASSIKPTKARGIANIGIKAKLSPLSTKNNKLEAIKKTKTKTKPPPRGVGKV